MGLMQCWYFFMCHSSISRDHGSELKDLYFSCWCRGSICYVFTWPHGNDSLDCNECIWRCSPPIVRCCFLSDDHASPRRQVSVYPLFAPTRISSVSERQWPLPTPRCLSPSHSCPYCRGPWSEDELALLSSYRWPVPRIEWDSESSHPAHSEHVRPIRAVVVGEWRIGWGTRYRGEIRHCWRDRE